MIHELWHTLLHALQDTWPLLPWVLFIYVILELLQNKADLSKINRLGGRLGPLVGSATGLIPQCGVSVMAAKLFERKYITVGTLISIFLATSDEAFILMLSSGEGAVWALPMIAVKFGIGLAFGYAVDGVLRLVGRKQECVEMISRQKPETVTVKEIFINSYLDEREVEVNCSCGRSHDGGWVNTYILSPLLRTLQVGAFILLVNFVLTWVIHEVGESNFIAFMHRNRFLQPIITCSIGLIPNCASSVVVTEAFLSGAITFGSCVAGLCANAGMGFVVLLKNTRQWKRNLALIITVYVLSVAVGLLFNLYPLMM